MPEQSDENMWAIYVILHVLGAGIFLSKNQVEINFNTFYSTHYIWNISNVNGIKVTEILTFYWFKVFKVWGLFYINITSLIGPAAFQTAW